MEKKKRFAFCEAIVGESIPDNYVLEDGVFNNLTHEDLYELCKTASYKVAHNISNGYQMNPDENPLVMLVGENPTKLIKCEFTN